MLRPVPSVRVHTLDGLALQSPHLKPLQMFPQRLAHQRRPIPFGSPRRLVGGLQEFSLQHDLDRFHMWNILHTKIHNQESVAWVF